MIYKLRQIIVCSHWSRLGWRLVYVSRETVILVEQERCEYYLTIINDDFFTF